jgi:pimeloyl-ACP methyl ester carboxylesterase
VNALNGNNRTSGYAPVNGLKTYYEVEGSGDPLIFIPAALGHAGMRAFPLLSQSRTVISVDLQGHGRTADIPERALSLEQYAEDLVGLLKCLDIRKADFLGESYGGAIATLIALRQSNLVRRVATYGATFGPPQVAHNREMLRFDEPPTAESKCFRFHKESYERVAPEPAYWSRFWGKVYNIRWDGFTDDQLKSITAPVLIAVGDHDFVRLEHAIETFRRIPNAELAVIPDAGHFLLFSEQARLTPVVKHFLEKPARGLPIGTAQMGYHPGETR